MSDLALEYLEKLVEARAKLARLEKAYAVLKEACELMQTPALYDDTKEPMPDAEALDWYGYMHDKALTKAEAILGGKDDA